MGRSHDLLSQLESHRSIDEREELSLYRLREFLRTSDDAAFDREAGNHHITASTLITNKSGLLLHYHKVIPLWLQPGGHLDTGETPREAAQRETREETGLDLKLSDMIFHIDVHDTPSGHVHYDVRYAARVTQPYVRPPKGESNKVAWFGASALSSITDPALVGAIQKLMKQDAFLV